jgi:hypothetical protein
MIDPLALAEVITVGNYEFANSLSEDVHINQGNLVGDFLEHPERFAYWATIYELALDQEVRLKNELQRMYAKVDHNTRLEAASAAVKMTEKKVENTVVTHPKYVEVLEEYNDAKLRSGLLKAARDAMIHRRDMLIQLGATARAEGASDISIREDAVKGIVGNK